MAASQLKPGNEGAGQHPIMGAAQKTFLTVRIMPTTKRGLRRFPEGFLLQIPAWFIAFISIPALILAVQAWVDGRKDKGKWTPGWADVIAHDETSMDYLLTMTSPIYAFMKVGQSIPGFLGQLAGIPQEVLDEVKKRVEERAEQLEGAVGAITGEVQELPKRKIPCPSCGAEGIRIANILSGVWQCPSCGWSGYP
jgi:hypothetical protein